MAYFRATPLIAILRGVELSRVEKIAECLLNSGIKAVEVPLNTPHAIKIVTRLVNSFGEELACGAGTVLSTEEAEALINAGAHFIFTPNIDTNLITFCLSSGVKIVPGAMTPTEIFAAYKLGVSTIKIFPAADLGASYFKNIKAVLPTDLELIAVGGIDATNLIEFQKQGIRAFGVGSYLFHPKMSMSEISVAAKSLSRALEEQNHSV